MLTEISNEINNIITQNFLDLKKTIKFIINNHILNEENIIYEMTNTLEIIYKDLYYDLENVYEKLIATIKDLNVITEHYKKENDIPEHNKNRNYINTNNKMDKEKDLNNNTNNEENISNNNNYSEKDYINKNLKINYIQNY